MFANYSRVSLLTDKFQDDGVGIGAVGYVIETYPPDAYEVEFSDADGATLAQIVVCHEELAPVPSAAPVLTSSPIGA